MAFFGIFINCIYAKSKYNSACIRFADYILTNRRKEAERNTADAERTKQMQNIREAAEHDREKAVAAAFQQGRSEGIRTVGASQPHPFPQTQQTILVPQQQQFPQPQPNMPMPMLVNQQPTMQHTAMQMPQQSPQPTLPSQPMCRPVPAPQQAEPACQRMPEPQPAREQMMPPNEEMLYNEYGEPVMVRRRVRKTAYSPDGEMLYDSHGNPVIRRNQGLWEPLEQRHEIVLKVETSPGVSVSQSDRYTSDRENMQ